MKKLLTIVLILMVAITTLMVPTSVAFADTPTSSFTIELCELSKTTLTPNTTGIDATVRVKYNGTDEAPNITVNKANCSFTGGKFIKDAEQVDSLENISATGKTYTFKLTGLTWTGDSKDFSLSIVNAGSTIMETVSTMPSAKYTTNADIQADLEWYRQQAEWQAQNPPQPTKTDTPAVIFSWKELDAPIKANETKEITVTVKNITTTGILSPLITFTPSSDLLVVGTQTAYEMKPIYANQSQSITIKVKALDTINSENQFVTANLSYKYSTYSTSGYSEKTDGTATGTIQVLAETSKGAKQDIATPNMIVKSFDYGKKDILAGDEFNLTVALKNTSKDVDIENVIVTVAGGADLTINGGTNTFYFEKIEKNDFEPITVPFKVGATLATTAQPITIAATFEYVSDSERKSGSANLLITVPTVQPDKFTIEEPIFNYVGGVGEETTFNMDYVNKGKSMIYNLEATVSGDVDCYNPTLRFGNVESGKNGVISFAVSPINAGDNKVVVDVSYEDANGEVKEKHFETTINAYSFEPIDPGFDDPGIEPMPEKKPFPWKIVIMIVVALAIVGLIVWRVLKKRAKVKKEKELWAKWEAEEEAKEDQAYLAEKKEEIEGDK